jgi:protein-S-isoprenylcysteine O-methyltransferase Ste14
MKESADRPRMNIIPPVYFLASLCIGIGLNQVLPTVNIPDVMGVSIGAGLIVLSILLAMWALIWFKRVNTPIDVRKPTTMIVTTGPYRISRNPLYLSSLMFITGFGLVGNFFWILLIMPLLILVINYAVINKEEQYLENKFGYAYIQYKASVRRWL